MRIPRSLARPVFVSYARENAAAAEDTLAALRERGFSTWSDHDLTRGRDYGIEIDEALHRTEAVVVLWSTQAVKSTWVKHEASIGRSRGVLVPHALEFCTLPAEFASRHTTGIDNESGTLVLPDPESLARTVDVLVRRRIARQSLKGIASLFAIVVLGWMLLRSSCEIQALLGSRFVVAECVNPGQLFNLGRAIGMAEIAAAHAPDQFASAASGIMDNLRHVRVVESGARNLLCRRLSVTDPKVTDHLDKAATLIGEDLRNHTRSANEPRDPCNNQAPSQ